MTDDNSNVQQGPFVMDLTGEMKEEFKRSVQISMPHKGGTHQFNIDCWFKYGTQDDISASGDQRTLMMAKLNRWQPALKVLVENPETGAEEPRTLSAADEDIEESKRLLLSIPWLRTPIANAWFAAVLGNSQSAGKTKN